MVRVHGSITLGEGGGGKGGAKYAKKAKIVFTTSAHVQKTKNIVVMFMKLFATFVKFMTPVSGVQALGWD